MTFSKTFIFRSIFAIAIGSFALQSFSNQQQPLIVTLSKFAGATTTQMNGLSNVSVVQLGEAIHMTNELPIAKLAALRDLNRFHHFDMILFEGSTIDAWIAADTLLSEGALNDEGLKNARNIAFPVIWRSEAYIKVLREITETWNTSHPLYLASYDLQPGMGQLRSETLKELFKVLEKYLVPTVETKAAVQPLIAFANRQAGFPNAEVDAPKMLMTIDALSKWITQAEPFMTSKYPHLPHGRTAMMIASQLRKQLAIWQANLKDPNKKTSLAYQETRDRFAADSIFEFSETVSPNHKVVVWAHNVHVFHNTLDKARHSLGSDLKQKLKERLFTIGTFAGAGECLGLNGEDVQHTHFDSTQERTLEAELAQLSKDDFYIDFRSVNDSKFKMSILAKTAFKVEGQKNIETIPKRDFDAAIFVHQVTSPTLDWK